MEKTHLYLVKKGEPVHCKNDNKTLMVIHVIHRKKENLSTTLQDYINNKNVVSWTAYLLRLETLNEI